MSPSAWVRGCGLTANSPLPSIAWQYHSWPTLHPTLHPTHTHTHIMITAARRRRSSLQLLSLLLPLLLAAAQSQQPAPSSGFEHHAALATQQLCPPESGIPAGSDNVVELNELTFQGRIADGRVWLVELYADWCRGCRRVASHVAMLADTLAPSHPHIVVARLNCGGLAEAFCEGPIGVTRTPSFKVYHQGKKAIDYNSEFYFLDLMLPFIMRVAADLKGFSPADRAAEAVQAAGGRSGGGDDESEDDDDDEYE